MATTTPNFGWPVPTSSDLVKNGATAIEGLGDAIDASLLDLKGGTTGQVLSKTSNTDMDFTWVAANPGDITGVTAGVGITGGGTSGTVTVTNDMATTITAAGDIVVGTGSGTYDNLPIGTTGQILTADTTVSPYKVKWATPGSGKIIQVVQGTLATSAVTNSTSFVDTGLTATITPTLATSKVLVIVNAVMGHDTTGGLGVVTLTDGSNTNLVVPTSPGSRTVGFGSLYGFTGMNLFAFPMAFTLLDSPGSTAAKTYKARYLALSGSYMSINKSTSDTSDPNYLASISSITLIEVGA
jgi:hypothetical protein